MNCFLRNSAKEIFISTTEMILSSLLRSSGMSFYVDSLKSVTFSSSRLGDDGGCSRAAAGTDRETDINIVSLPFLVVDSFFAGGVAESKVTNP
jgi:hypothetical protein